MAASIRRQIGQRIRRLRKAQHQSQQVLAMVIGVHVNTVARWECDGIDPGHQGLPLIAAALQCSLEQLMGEPAIKMHRRNGVIMTYLQGHLAQGNYRDGFALIAQRDGDVAA